MIEAYRQRAERDGIVYKQISFDFPMEDDAAIVKAYEEAITPRTRLIHVTHMVNWVGQTMPVARSPTWPTRITSKLSPTARTPSA